MSRKKILNLTSKKKHDLMAPNRGYPASSDPAAVSAVIVPSGPGYYASIWCATARPLREIFENDRGEVVAGRNASECFIRGISEKTSYLSDSGTAWRHRQIVFTNKGDLPLGEEFEGDRTISSVTDSAGRETFYRGVAELPETSRVPLNALLFRGNSVTSEGVRDWVDLITAPLDTSRFKILSNTVYHIHSGNEQGINRTRKKWYPVNHNLRYGDEEFGNQMFSSYKSTTGRPGIGDIYVYDIISSATITTGSTLAWAPSTTLYWHEK